MWDNINSFEGLVIRGFKSSTEMTLWAFAIAQLASSQKVPTTALSRPMLRATSLVGVIISNDDVEEVGCRRASRIVEEVTT